MKIGERRQSVRSNLPVYASAALCETQKRASSMPFVSTRGRMVDYGPGKRTMPHMRAQYSFQSRSEVTRCKAGRRCHWPRPTLAKCMREANT